MTEPLFHAIEPPFVEKIASEAKLSDNADTWAQEVSDELMKQHPYLGTYDVLPVMTETDGDRGFGLGYFQVSSQSAQPPLGPGTKAMRAAQGVKVVKIPIVIREGHLLPLDVFIDSEAKSYPLNQTRLRAALYRWQMFDRLKPTVGDARIAEHLYPPASQSRANQVLTMSEPFSKLSAQKPEYVMEAIAPTVLEGDISRLTNQIEKDAELRRALVHNEACLPLLTFISGLEPTTAHDVAKVAAARIRPDVLQVERQEERYLLKTADSQMFTPQITEADRPSMVELAGEDVVREADRLGAVTISTDPVVRTSLEDEEASPIEQFGEYRVKRTDGQEMLGWVFPVVLDYDGTALPFTIFTNGSESAIQDSIVGSLVGKSANIIRGKPQGYGFFYRVTANGNVIAFQPSEIKGRSVDEKGPLFLVHTLLNQVVRIRLMPNIKQIVVLAKDEDAEEMEVGLPADIRWAPLGTTSTKLVDNAEDFVKQASLNRRHNTVQIISDGQTWSFRGGSGVTKLAHRWREGLTGGDAMFVACALGMSPPLARQTLIKAAQQDAAEVAGCRELHFPEERLAVVRKEAAALFEHLPPKPLLLKEAAALEDVSTVDRVLSVGFINPENVQVFVDYLPEFDKTVSRLAELLLATRVGLQDVPENSVKSAMERLEEVVEGLKKLVFRKLEA